MHPAAFLRLVLLAAALFGGATLRAETNASCCRCAAFYKLSDEGFGYLRHHIGFCPACTTEMGGDVEAYLEHRADAARLEKEKDLSEFQQQLEADFLPPLLPFWLGVEDEFSRDLNQELLQLADPAAEKASRLFDRIIRRGEGAGSMLKGTMPPAEAL